ncbi:hypothetical protein AMECASPLE_036254 [Ameca splendens]|uniref:Uncharacterized protein n=1 Tax=Ameca splendens TaxID=208324 RepID=A0ABV0XWG3_9TELE
MMVLKAELKSTNRILAYVPGWSRCCRMKCRPKLTASSANLFARCRLSSGGEKEQVLTHQRGGGNESSSPALLRLSVCLLWLDSSPATAPLIPHCADFLVSSSK